MSTADLHIFSLFFLYFCLVDKWTNSQFPCIAHQTVLLLIAGVYRYLAGSLNVAEGGSRAGPMARLYTFLLSFPLPLVLSPAPTGTH